nr:hypothetical protein [Tanacetum cinerariifolium]
MNSATNRIEQILLEIWLRILFFLDKSLWDILGIVLGLIWNSYIKGKPETVFGSNLSSNKRANEDNGEVHSEDPFGVYDLLEKNKKVVGSMVSPSLSHPPGFTPMVSKNNNMNNNVNDVSDLVSENNNMNNNANDVSDYNVAHTTSTGADNIDPKPQVDAPVEQSCE